MASAPPGLGAFLRPLAYTSTLLLGVNGITTSLLFVPALLRPLTTVAPSAKTSSSSSSSSLEVPSAAIDSGRLTPQVSHREFDFGQHRGTSGTYKAVARQFAQLQASSSLYNVPLEAIAAITFGVLAYKDRGTEFPRRWAAAAGTLVGIDLLKAWLVAPLALKLLRIAGDAEPVEPYEDAPIDREAEKSNTVQFLRKWSVLNLGSSVAVVVTAVFAWTAEL